ncbi:MAG: DUF4262 domain-containing protein [Chthoniobacter sp.]|uniref:DUF4262 domain-containing protein n=1 Tax=Chthoniobacter sp. TaxID=2510640 RepID=UPI0032ACA8D1
MSPRIAGFRWLTPQDPLDERIYREILADGCAILSFNGSPTAPEFTYSVGLYLNFLHPEVLLMGLHPDTAAGIIARLRDEADRGLMMEAGSVRTDLFEDGRPVRFIPAPQERYLDYLGRNCSFYFSLFVPSIPVPDFHFPVLQGIWPDRQGRFPDEPDCDPRFAAIHRLTPQP